VNDVRKSGQSEDSQEQTVQKAETKTSETVQPTKLRNQKGESLIASSRLFCDLALLTDEQKVQTFVTLRLKIKQTHDKHPSLFKSVITNNRREYAIF
jgi:hypothetical protein